MKDEMQHPLWARLLHWGIVIAMLMMILTGLYIHDPNWIPIFSSLGIVWPLHYIFAVVLVALVVMRIVYGGITGDINELIMRPRDVKNLGPVIKYYVFLRKDEPDQGKYNAGQRMTYCGLWIPLLIVQVATGIILFVSIDDVTMRAVHYIVTWLSIATIVAHVYLGSIHGWKVIKSMITGRLPQDKARKA